ncbi:hypothetical protein QJS10_CPA03g00107 [Acorus calamus]|uniref:AAA+ ATPase domain-containing protein n=1 Tax=Acorus calamus TaxID=4465 RepID=A0AAV9FBK8_ACOCL|nr:hypothetical protein QJS10_CPA03g00107 [Acorus calamus]
MGRRAPGPRLRTGTGPMTSKLLSHLDSFDHRSLDLDSIVEQLRLRNVEYRRINNKNFRRDVSKALDLHKKSRADASPHRSPTRKRPKHREPFSSSPSSSGSGGGGGGSSSSSDVSSSDDLIFEQKFEPEFDLTKSMLRANYGVSAASASASKPAPPTSKEAVEKNVEVEEVRLDKGKAVGDGRTEVIRGNVKGPRFRDLGGMKKTLDEVLMDVVVPLCHPEVAETLGVRPTRGVLLCGPPGCGKTSLAHAIANETGVPFYKISATEVVSGVSGASEKSIRLLFRKAYRSAPSIVFIDEIDAIASKREDLHREMERRIVTQLMTCMDESHQPSGSENAGSGSDPELSNKKCGHVLVIGATNRPDAMDSALRRPGRFDKEFYMDIPDETARAEILSVVTRKLRLHDTLDIKKIARSTPGYVGADLEELANKAGNLAMRRIIEMRKSDPSKMINGVDEDNDQEWWRKPWVPEEIEKLSITMADFEEAAKIVQPSLKREGFTSIPNAKMEDIGGLEMLRKELNRYVVQRIKSPEEYEEFGVNLETGFLLYGPPGCGKTLIAKAVANETGANFIHIKGPELLNKYVGESELAVRRIFNRARTCAPCILFFDEVDALTKERGTDGGWVVERLVNQLLVELDGADQRKGVYVIGATNRPEVVDRALLRPGRFGKLLYVPLPNPEERGSILKAHAQMKPWIDYKDVDFGAIGKACENFSGADLAKVMGEAAMIAMEERQAGVCSKAERPAIKASHFIRALELVGPSVSEKQKKYYAALSRNFGTIPKKDDTTGSNYTFQGATRAPP